MHRNIKSILALGSAVLGAAAPAWAGGRTELVSVGPRGVQGNGCSASFVPGLSADGRFISFYSLASNLVPGDTNQDGDFFVRDRIRGRTSRVSVSSNGDQATPPTDGPNVFSDFTYLSADGRLVAFDSGASNLVPGDTNHLTDVFVRDEVTRRTERVSIGAGGVQPNRHSGVAGLSSDGRYVLFVTNAANLVAGDNDDYDWFVRDLENEQTQIVSVASNGVMVTDFNINGGFLSATGQFFLFGSGTPFVAADTGQDYDVYVHDRVTLQTELVSVNSDGDQGDSDSSPVGISPDGRFVYFSSFASNLGGGDTPGADLFVHDRLNGTTERVGGDAASAAVNDGYLPSLSANGRFLTFTSGAPSVVAGDTNEVDDVFVNDLVTGDTRRASVGPGDRQANGFSSSSVISADGKVVAFGSDATNLAPRDLNGTCDVFVRVLGKAE